MHIKNHGGFTLLEILIAISVLAVGLLGLAGLQVTSLKNNNSAYMRSQATFLAYDLADRVRANMNSDYVTALGNASTHDGHCLVADPGCSATEMAEYDMAVWLAQVASILPEGEGIICRDGDGDINDGTPSSNGCSGSSSDFTIKIWWDDDRSGNPDKLFAMSFQP